MRAISAAQRGATALVPPITLDDPSTRTWYPVVGSASPATSGTPRPTNPFGALGTFSPAWNVGKANSSLTPPPVAPSPLASSFQTVSWEIAPPESSSRVPPQAITAGLDAGKSTLSPAAGPPSSAPLSPAAASTVTPRAAASTNTDSNAARACAVQVPSGPPQLTETTVGRLVASWTAVETASRNPWSVFGAK